MISFEVTNDDGIAKFHYPFNNTGKYLFKASFNGNENFLNISNDLTVTIPENKNNETNNTNETNGDPINNPIENTNHTQASMKKQEYQ